MRDHYGIPGDQFYHQAAGGITPGERVQIGDDIICASTASGWMPRRRIFEESMEGFGPKQAPHDSQFSGHVNGTVALQHGLSIGILPLFPDCERLCRCATNSCLVMGDNTCGNILDSTFWGPIPESHVIGKSFFVYWPLTSRFGWGNR